MIGSIRCCKNIQMSSTIMILEFSSKSNCLKNVMVKTEIWRNCCVCAHWLASSNIDRKSKSTLVIRSYSEVISINFKILSIGHFSIQSWLWDSQVAVKKGVLTNVLTNKERFDENSYEDGERLKVVNYFCNKLHLRCLAGLWMRLWDIHFGKNGQDLGSVSYPITFQIFSRK